MRHAWIVLLLILFCNHTALSHAAVSARHPQPSVSNRQIDIDLVDACQSKDIDKVASLLRKGANVNCVTDDSWGTPLTCAASTPNNTEMIRLLIRHYANVNGYDNQGSTALNQGSTALMIAASSGSPDNARVLLESGANPNARDSGGSTALHSAMLNEQDAVSMTKLLIAHGSQIDAKDRDGQTALVWASSARVPDAVSRYLVERGASVTTEDNAGIPVWMNFRRSPVLLDFMLKHGAKINDRTRDGLTCLDIAAGSGIRSTVELLISRGANVNLTGPHGETPYSLAAKRFDVADRDDVIQALIVAGEKDVKPIAKTPDVDVAPNSPAIPIIKAVLLSRQSKKGYIVFVRDTVEGKSVFVGMPKLEEDISRGFPPRLFQAFLQTDVEVLPEMGDIPNVVSIRYADLDDLFKNGGWWDRFYKKYSGAGGVLSVSLPAISADGSDALVYVSFSCGGLCGNGEICRLKKGPSGWAVTSTTGLWVS